jgi:hypothetical protein
LGGFGASPEVIRHLIALGADPNHRAPDRWDTLTTLFWWLGWNLDPAFAIRGNDCSGGFFDCVRAALDLGAKWAPVSAHEFATARRAVVRMEDAKVVRLVYCSRPRPRARTTRCWDC